MGRLSRILAISGVVTAIICAPTFADGVDGRTAATSTAVIDDSQAGWTWTGMVEIDDPQLKNGSAHAGRPGTSCAYTFSGTAVDVYGMAGAAVDTGDARHKIGGLRISLDGKPLGTFGERADSAVYDFRVVHISGLSAGNHVLQMAPVDGWAVVDYLSLTSAAAPDDTPSTLAQPQGGQAVKPVQRIADPSYFYEAEKWSAVISGAPAVGIVIVNPASGPGKSMDPHYVQQVRNAHTRGIKVLGYVATHYAKRDIATIENEVGEYFEWYSVDGILFDEASNQPEDVGFYATLHDYIKHGAPSAMIVLNPGCQTDEAYMSTADVISIFEGSFQDYASKYDAPAWVSKYPSNRFWNLIYSTETEDEMRTAVALSRERNAGWVYVTPQGMPNPWSILPPSPYWSSEISMVSTR